MNKELMDSFWEKHLPKIEWEDVAEAARLVDIVDRAYQDGPPGGGPPGEGPITEVRISQGKVYAERGNITYWLEDGEWHALRSV